MWSLRGSDEHAAGSHERSRRDGPGRDDAPYRPTGTEDGQGWRGRERDAVHGRDPGDPPSLAGALQVVRRRARRGTAQGFC